MPTHSRKAPRDLINSWLLAHSNIPSLAVAAGTVAEAPQQVVMVTVAIVTF